MHKISLYDKLASLPQSLQKEVEDFIDFLTTKNAPDKEKTSPRFGSGNGMFVMSSTFDDPFDDFNEYIS